MNAQLRLIRCSNPAMVEWQVAQEIENGYELIRQPFIAVNSGEFCQWITAGFGIRMYDYKLITAADLTSFVQQVNRLRPEGWDFLFNEVQWQGLCYQWMVRLRLHTSTLELVAPLQNGLKKTDDAAAKYEPRWKQIARSYPMPKMTNDAAAKYEPRWKQIAKELSDAKDDERRT